jgi:hypothetical protein
MVWVRSSLHRIPIYLGVTRGHGVMEVVAIEATASPGAGVVGREGLIDVAFYH